MDRLPDKQLSCRSWSRSDLQLGPYSRNRSTFSPASPEPTCMYVMSWLGRISTLSSLSPPARNWTSCSTSSSSPVKSSSAHAPSVSRTILYTPGTLMASVNTLLCLTPAHCLSVLMLSYFLKTQTVSCRPSLHSLEDDISIIW